MTNSYPLAAALATFLLLIAGALVTSTDSGLAVPDWPLSYGTWFPPMVGGIRFEHGHRMIAGTVGLMILVLAVRLGRREPKRWVRRLGYAALGAVIVQALLGGLTVLWLLPPPVSIAHACLGQTVFVLVVCIAYGTSSRWLADPPRLPADLGGGLARLGLAAAFLAAGQLVLGAVIRHTGYAVAVHIAGAVGLTAVIGGLAAQAARVRRNAAGPWGSVDRLLLLLVCQLGIGAAVFWQRGSVLLRTAHVAVGALVLAQAVLLAWELVRRTPSLDFRSGRRPERSRRTPATSPRRIPGSWRDYLELTKPRLSLLVLLTTAVGYWLGRPTHAGFGRWLLLLLGTALVVGGANALNQWMEWEPDARMLRTRNRPVPAGRLAPHAALRFGAGLSAAGVLLLAGTVNWLSALLAAAGWLSYVLVYTPMKRWTPLCTLVGAIPGAVPPLIGWAGAREGLSGEAWTLFAILFIWQLPHFLSLAVLYRDDYALARFPMLPLIEDDGLIASRQIVLYGMALLPISLFPAATGLAARPYAYGAFLLSLLFVALAVRAAWVRSRPATRQLFLGSVAYLPLLLGWLAVNRSPF